MVAILWALWYYNVMVISHLAIKKDNNHLSGGWKHCNIWKHIWANKSNHLHHKIKHLDTGNTADKLVSVYCLKYLHHMCCSLSDCFSSICMCSPETAACEDFKAAVILASKVRVNSLLSVHRRSALADDQMWFILVCFRPFIIWHMATVSDVFFLFFYILNSNQIIFHKKTPKCKGQELLSTFSQFVCCKTCQYGHFKKQKTTLADEGEAVVCFIEWNSKKIQRNTKLCVDLKDNSWDVAPWQSGVYASWCGSVSQGHAHISTVVLSPVSPHYS